MCNRSINGKELLKIIMREKWLKAYYNGRNEKFNFKLNLNKRG